MAISLANLRRATATLPARIIVYGPHGMGKTTLAAEFPNAVFLQIEDGTPSDISIDTFGKLKSYDEVLEAIGALYSEDHGFQTVVLDSLDKFEPLVWANTCKAQKWESIESPGYGKGYVMADATWREFLDGCDALRHRGMMVVLIAHSEIGRFDDPTTVSYSKYDLRLHKRALALVQDEVDAILFVNQDATIKSEKLGFDKSRAHAEGGLQRWIHTEPRPHINAKNRYGLPSKILYKKGEGFNSIASYLPQPTANDNTPAAANDNAPAEEVATAA